MWGPEQHLWLLIGGVLADYPCEFQPFAAAKVFCHLPAPSQSHPVPFSVTSHHKGSTLPHPLVHDPESALSLHLEYSLSIMSDYGGGEDDFGNEVGGGAGGG